MTLNPHITVSPADKQFQMSAKGEGNRVRLRAGNQYLHWSGQFLTDNPKHAWTGTVEQAVNCRRRFDAAAGCRTVEA